MSEITDLLDGLTPQQHRHMLAYLFVQAPAAFDRALASAQASTTGWAAAS